MSEKVGTSVGKTSHTCQVGEKMTRTRKKKKRYKIVFQEEQIVRLIRNLTREREMFLQAVQNRNAPLASSASYSRPPRCLSPVASVSPSKKAAVIVCSISQVYGYSTVDYEIRPIIQWNAIKKKIYLMEKPELGAASVLNQWEKGGCKLTKWELCRVVKKLHKYNRPNQAFEGYDWMNYRGERFPNLNLEDKVDFEGGSIDRFDANHPPVLFRYKRRKKKKTNESEWGQKVMGIHKYNSSNKGPLSVGVLE